MELVLLLPYARMILRNPLGVMMESQLRVMMESVLRVMMEPATHARNGPPKRRVMIVFGRRTGRSLLALFLAFSLSVVSESGALHVFWCRAFVCCRCCFSVFFFYFCTSLRERRGDDYESRCCCCGCGCFVFFPLVFAESFSRMQSNEGKRREGKKGRKEGL